MPPPVIDKYLNPAGFLYGETAQRAVEQGVAQRLAGGAVAFSRIESISLSLAGEIEAEVGSLSDGDHDLSGFTRPRPGFGGLSVQRPLIMGIVNVTPDSFSDGGDHYDAGMAIARALEHAEAGADIIDIGGESTRPGATKISIADEIDRVLPVVEAAVESGIRVSVDTRHGDVMQAAIEAGASIINDVTAFTDDHDSLEIVAGSGAGIVLTHMQGTPQTMQQAPAYRLASADIYDWLGERVSVCLAADIPLDLIAVDPGIGFGKNDWHNVEILNRAAMFHGLGCAVAIGVSRKSFIGRLAAVDDPKQRLPGTIAATLLALDRGVQIHRVHDVAEVKQAISIWAAQFHNG